MNAQGKKLQAASSPNSPRSASSSPLLYTRLPAGMQVQHTAAGTGLTGGGVGSSVRASPQSAHANSSECGATGVGSGREFGVEFGYVTADDAEEEDGEVAAFCGGSDEDSFSSASEAEAESGSERGGGGGNATSSSPHSIRGPAGGNDVEASEPTRRRSRSMVQSRKSNTFVSTNISVLYCVLFSISHQINYE